YAALLAVTVITETENVAIFLAAGAVVWLVRRPPTRLAPSGARALFIPLGPFLAAAPTSDGGALVELFLFFAKAGTFVFGSGLAIVPFLYGGVVQEHQWLDKPTFLDAVAVAMITPGPVVITVAFIGY